MSALRSLTGARRSGPTARGRARRSPIAERVALVVVAVMILLAVIGPWIAPFDPNRVDLALALQPPSATHWLGTDVNGRDVLSRILVGARVTLSATGIVLAITLVIGVVVGTLAALGGRVLDEVLMRITDIGLALPSLILALGFAVALGPGLESAVVAIAATWWPGYARLVRSVVRETRHADFVESATALGVSRWRLVTKHVLPNSLDSMYVQVTLDVAAVMLVISGLSFIGVGAQVPSAEWGAMIAAASDNVVNGWWSLLFPGLAIAVTAISFNLAGDWLRVRRDPTLREGASR
ncbi:ABC transporter permease [Rathayibacter sp. VKM Ac-2835]|uniref:ABC transporter permease n=1 Tax=Rathayibacter sp. VKM Ac-2835 TaxID=2739043 RepID=UPI001566577C|nr:ABC transporter permease [Rathayibacter sp. VKM Ac-2835]NRG42312.1 ABC transporter permease [Rathayibacter sp. VKM Ac-2835]